MHLFGLTVKGFCVIAQRMVVYINWVCDCYCNDPWHAVSIAVLQSSVRLYTFYVVDVDLISININYK